MRKLITLAAAGLILAFSSAQASAEMLVGLSYDMPLQYTLTDNKIGMTGTTNTVDSTSVYGSKIGVKVLFLPGIGIEKYTLTTKFKSGDKIKFDYMMYDLFFSLPVPIVHAALGIGYGGVKAADQTIGGAVYGSRNTPIYQYWASLGFPIIPFFDIHVGYHVITAKDIKQIRNGTETTTKYDLSGKMVSLGMKFDF